MKPLIHIESSLDPYHNLAKEEYFLRNVGEDEIILYIWQNDRTVVIGRNQNIWSEVNMEYLERNGIHPTRRHSGGGAVYHDTGNLNFTFICSAANSDITRETGVILDAVRAFGADAIINGRNDLCVDGRKFSGHSFHRNGDNVFHNGTLLIDTDMDILSSVLNVPQEKLESKGVKSVRSRTVNLVELVPDITVEAVKASLARSLEKEYGPATFIAKPYIDADELSSIICRLSSSEWIFNKVSEYSRCVRKHFDWGNAEILLNYDGQSIKDCQVFTDSLDTDKAEELRKSILLENLLSEHSEIESPVSPDVSAV